jgi:hypothetical protein
MRTTLRFLAAALATTAIGGAVAAAPAAVAAPPIPRPSAPTPAPPPPGDGSDPLVPTNTGANPFVFIPQGDELPG